MRPAIAAWGAAAFTLAVASAAVHAEEITASGALGAGAFASEASATVDVGVDVAGERYAVGVGARLRFLAEGGLRGEEWDEASEFGRLLRYALFADDDLGGWEIAAALGELGGVELGSGAIIGGYAAGLDADHGRAGGQLRVRHGRATGELLVDDLTGPRIAGLRGAAALSPALEVGVSAAGDRVAPDGATMHAMVGAVAADAALTGVTGDGRWLGRARSEAVAVLGHGAGLHAGVGGELAVERVRVGLDLELRAGTGGYVPGWIGPLYEIERRRVGTDRGEAPGLVAASRMGGLGGLSGAAQLAVSGDELGRVALAYSQRRGLHDVASLRLELPHFRQAQAALWTATTWHGGRLRDAALAAELRVRLPRHLFIGAEAARLVHMEEGALEPMWSVTAAIGAVLGESP